MYAQKRTVIDGSKRRGNVVGFFYSPKMLTTVQYQSLSECTYLYKLELDPCVKEYYIQPVEVPVIIGNGNSSGQWPYVPDVLVFYKDGTVKLIEIKYNRESENDPQHISRVNAARAYCKHKGWTFQVVYPLENSPVVINNTMLLIKYIYPREGLDRVKEEALSLLVDKKILFGDLADRISENLTITKSRILPHLFHLLAIGLIKTNIFMEVNSMSLVWIDEN